MSHTVLIIGLGQIGMGYDLNLDSNFYVYSHARAFSIHSDFQIIAGVDTDLKKRKIFENSYCCKSYADLESAFKDFHPDVVIIALPTHLHAHTLRFILTRIKPNAIICEKPLSYDFAEAHTMVQACADKDVKLYVNYYRRSDPGVLEIKRRLVSGEMVTPVKGVAWYSKGLIHNGSHLINLLQFWLGPVIENQVINTGCIRDDKDSEPDFEIKFMSGTVVFLAAWEEKFSHYTIELLSHNGRLQYERGGEIIKWQSVQPDANLVDYHVLVNDLEIIHTGIDKYQLNVVEQLSAEMNNNSYNLCTGLDALATLDCIQPIIDRV